jgi:transcriptional regulator with GAF, ATPase, and Fis domain
MDVCYQDMFLSYSSKAQEPLSSLSREEMHLQPCPVNASSVPCIIFFDEVAPRLQDYLKELSMGSLQRTLMISLADHPSAASEKWLLLKLGVADVLSWGNLRDPSKTVKARLERWKEIDEEVDSPLMREGLVGRSPSWVFAIRRVVEAAKSKQRPSLLLVGEPGTGKELVACLIHRLSTCGVESGPVVVDCTTIVPELSGSEFFGHERGAFTGAASSREVAFALADGGTLFLDEIGELPLQLQAQLLRVIQEKSYKRVGGNTWHRTDFRLVCATNRDLSIEVSQGRFRRDLYDRISTEIINLPPLRDRTEDILPLVNHFLKCRFSESDCAILPELDDSVRDYLVARSYPGNVRELKHLVERMVIRYTPP